MDQSQTLDQLTKNLETLTRIMETSERRYQRLERSFRWLGITFASMLAIVLVMGTNWITHATASSPIAAIEQSILPFGTLIAAADKMLKQMGEEKVMAKLQTFGEMLHDMAMLAKWAENKVDNDKQVAALGNDLMVLLSRIKQDSDILRAYTLYKNQNNPDDRFMVHLYNKTSEKEMNRPEGSAAVNIHNATESVSSSLRAMVWSMDSTAGRMGRAWSWMPSP